VDQEPYRNMGGDANAQKQDRADEELLRPFALIGHDLILRKACCHP
jgi:hypothetical protein